MALLTKGCDEVEKATVLLIYKAPDLSDSSSWVRVGFC